jgi:hypothetical protein
MARSGYGPARLDFEIVPLAFCAIDRLVSDKLPAGRFGTGRFRRWIYAPDFWPAAANKG